MRARAARLPAILGAGAALASCGSDAQQLPAACAGRAALARALARPASTLAITPLVASSGAPACRFAAGAGAGAGAPVVTVSLDSSPQPYYRLERTVVEATQTFSRRTPSPVNLPGIGVDADWFPLIDSLMTTDGRRLVTVEVSWAGARPQAKIGLAAVVARAYVGSRGGAR